MKDVRIKSYYDRMACAWINNHYDKKTQWSVKESTGITTGQNNEMRKHQQPLGQDK